MLYIWIFAVQKKDAIDDFNRVANDYIDAIEWTGMAYCSIIPANSQHLDLLIEKFDGFIMPGGPDIDPSMYGSDNHGSTDLNPRYDRYLIDAVHKIGKSGKFLIGICKGMQIINVTHGGTLTQNITDASRHNRFDLQKEFIHSIEIESSSQLEKIVRTNTMEVNSIHHQAIEKLWAGLKVSAKSDDGYIEAIESLSGKMIGFQWHPEALPNKIEFFRKLISYSFYN